MPEEFRDRVTRISREQNISRTMARRIASAEIRIEESKLERERQ